MTAAKWMREFVMSHPKYEHDSVISEEINYDLLLRIAKLSENPAPNLLGTTRVNSKTQDNVPEIFKE